MTDFTCEDIQEPTLLAFFLLPGFPISSSKWPSTAHDGGQCHSVSQHQKSQKSKVLDQNPQNQKSQHTEPLHDKSHHNKNGF